MDKNYFDRIYETICGLAWDEYAVPGVENIFREGSVCSLAYEEISHAYERLRERLRVQDEDPDIEIILNNFWMINREIAAKVLEYGNCCRKKLQEGEATEGRYLVRQDK